MAEVYSNMSENKAELKSTRTHYEPTGAAIASQAQSNHTRARLKQAGNRARAEAAGPAESSNLGPPPAGTSNFTHVRAPVGRTLVGHRVVFLWLFVTAPRAPTGDILRSRRLALGGGSMPQGPRPAFRPHPSRPISCPSPIPSSLVLLAWLYFFLSFLSTCRTVGLVFTIRSYLICAVTHDSSHSRSFNYTHTLTRTRTLPHTPPPTHHTLSLPHLVS